MQPFKERMSLSQGLYQPHLTDAERDTQESLVQHCGVWTESWGSSHTSQTLSSVFSAPWGPNPFALTPDLGPLLSSLLQPPSPTAGILTGDDNGARARSFNGDQDGGFQRPRAKGHATHILA